MKTLEHAFLDIGRLDLLASQDTFVHRLDPAAKVLTGVVYVLCVVSFGKYELSALLPFLIFPVWLAGVGRVPFAYIAKKLLAVAPFAFMVAIWNPVFDQKILFRIGETGISGGWLSFFSIMTRFALTVGAAFLLIAVTSFQGLCLGLQKLGMPRVMTVQLLFLYRYLFVLGAEAMSMSRARALRSFKGRGMGIKIFTQIVGNLLLRTIDRATRIYQAMLARGFDGEMRLARKTGFGGPEAAFTLFWSAIFLVFRFVNVPELLGTLFANAIS